MSAPDLHTWFERHGASVAAALPGVRALTCVAESGQVRFELSVGDRTLAVRVRPRDEAGAYARSSRFAFAVDLGGAGSLPPAMEAAVRSVVALVSKLDEDGLTLPSPDHRPSTHIDLLALLSLPLADQVARNRRDGLDAVVIDRDRVVRSDLVPLRNSPPRTAHLLGPSTPDDPWIDDLARLGVVSTHLVILRPSEVADPAGLRARGVRRVLVPWPLPAEERPALRALRAAGIEIVAIATSPSAFDDLKDLAQVARVLVAPESPSGTLPLGLTVVRSGLPARLGSEGVTAFLPAALHPPFRAPPPR